MNSTVALGVAMLAAAAIGVDDSDFVRLGRGSNPRKVKHCPKCGKSTHKDGYGRESCDFCSWPKS